MLTRSTELTPRRRREQGRGDSPPAVHQATRKRSSTAFTSIKLTRSTARLGRKNVSVQSHARERAGTDYSARRGDPSPQQQAIIADTVKNRPTCCKTEEKNSGDNENHHYHHSFRVGRIGGIAYHNGENVHNNQERQPDSLH